jgi:DNA helicase II / ATP-dependent DNA helicase PcrA
MNSQTVQKVTISTCHAAKGLEWPVVFIPSGMCHTSRSIIRLNDCQVEEGTFPFYRTEDVEEERSVILSFYSYADLVQCRRLLYVACESYSMYESLTVLTFIIGTRAQVLLYLTTTKKRKLGGG